jgi:hypothetical protein
MAWKPGRMIAVALLFGIVALVIYGVTASPAEAPPRASAPALAAARFFVLLPDGRVEISDAWNRRVFRWDGHRWLQTESRSLPRSEAR